MNRQLSNLTFKKLLLNGFIVTCGGMGFYTTSLNAAKCELVEQFDNAEQLAMEIMEELMQQDPLLAPMHEYFDGLAKVLSYSENTAKYAKLVTFLNTYKDKVKELMKLNVIKRGAGFKCLAPEFEKYKDAFEALIPASLKAKLTKSVKAQIVAKLTKTVLTGEPDRIMPGSVLNKIK